MRGKGLPAGVQPRESWFSVHGCLKTDRCVDVLVLTCFSHLFVSRSALIYCLISLFLCVLVWLLVTDERQENRIMTGNRSVLFLSVANFLCLKDILV